MASWRCAAACRAKNSAPIRIGAEPRRLAKGRIRNRLCAYLRVSLAGGAVDIHLHELGDAFAVQDHAFRQIGHHILQGFTERRAFGRSRLDFIVSGGAVREDEHRVVRARVAVDRDAVEGVADGGGQAVVQGGAINDRIRRQIAEHRGLRRLHLQLRGNHARAFRHAADAHRRAADFQRHREMLRNRVRRHDGAGGRLAAVRRQFLHAHLDAFFNDVHRHRNADTASTCDG